MLLHDPVERVLERIGGAEVRYFNFTMMSVGKCERATLRELQEQGKEIVTHLEAAESGNSSMKSVGGESTAEQHFDTYMPQQFPFQWAFPGLNLCYVPLNWQDLFADFSRVF